MITSEQDLVNKYNQVCKAHQKKESLLKDLTDSELLIWIAGQTYKFGRDWESSVSNAMYHLRNRTKAEKMFSTRRVDTLGAC
jgi:hypothetical protein